MKTISVNGKECEVETDKDGTLRFKRNRIVFFLFELTKSQGGVDLNLIRSLENIFAEEELLEFYRLLGYSVAGFREVFPDAEIAGAPCPFCSGVHGCKIEGRLTCACRCHDEERVQEMTEAASNE